MSGVVNKNVADRAVAVQADELVRKPFQPQELIGRVKNLLGHANPPAQAKEELPAAVPSLSSLFATQPSNATATPRLVRAASHMPISPSLSEGVQSDAVWPRALAEAFLQQNPEGGQQSAQQAAPPSAARPSAAHAEPNKLRAEIARLDLLVKKLQTELQIERHYNQALEMHVRR